jgi:hypothetical protein
MEVYKNQQQRIQHLLNLYGEKDISCKQYIGHLTAKDKEETEIDDEIIKRKKKEKQQAIMSKFQQVRMKKE